MSTTIGRLLRFTSTDYAIADPRPAPDSTDVKVLFLGNSLLGENNIPLMVSKLAAAEGRHMWFQSHLKGGAMVVDHLSAARSTPPDGYHWDAVIIQPHSLKFLSRSWFSNPAKALNETLSTVNSKGSSTIVMIPWPRRDYPESPQTQLTKQLELANESIISPNRIAPTGFAWIRAITQSRIMELYADDGNHAKETGAVLTALTLYQAIFRTNECPQQGLAAIGASHEQTQILCSASSDASAYLRAYRETFPIWTTQSL